jgi:dTMP kinase
VNKPLFITFEGGEGVGKTTQVKLLSEWMSDRNISHVTTKEPGAPDIKECIEIRKVLLNPKYDITGSAELLLFLADRAQHVEKFIIPKIRDGMNVVCDRFSDSTRVYQSIRKIGRTKLDLLLAFATRGLVPDMTFILDMPVKEALERSRAKSEYEGGDRIEREVVDFHEKVHQGFRKLSESLSEQGRVILIDVSSPKTIKQIHDEIVVHISRRFWAD